MAGTRDVFRAGLRQRRGCESVYCRERDSPFPLRTTASFSSNSFLLHFTCARSTYETPSLCKFDMPLKHEKLPHKRWIRLITIHSDLADGNIACTLQHFDADAATSPFYAALSYNWGNPATRHAILINDAPRRIHQNLWQYLSHAHQSREQSRLWIDSLCLDQDNHAEKNEQVPRMGDIWFSATSVIAWI